MVKSKNILVLVLIAFALSIQIWLISIFALQPFPPPDTLSGIVFPEWQDLVKPERDALHFHIFIFVALGLTAMIFWRLRRSLADPSLIQKAKLFLGLEIIWTFLLLSAAFKTIVYPKSPQLAACLFWVIAVIGLAGKIFFKPFSIFLQQAYRYLHTPSTFLVRWVEIAFPIFLVSILYIPDAHGVMARDFMGEQYHHWDSAVMSPGWAYLSGCALNVDVISQYGLGLPILVAQLSKILGGFSYEHVLRVMVVVNMIYYLGWYWLLCSWLKNKPLVIAGMLFAIKIQMFNTSSYPIVFTYPSSTVLRYMFDVVLFAFMLGHLRTGKYAYLWAGSVICGIAIFYMTTTGLCLALTWGAYLGSLALLPGLRLKFLSRRHSWLALPACAALVAAAVMSCLWLAEGKHTFTGEFWHNTQEFSNYFLNYFGTVPLSQNITDHNYLPLLMGILIPLIYLGTFLVVLSLYFWRKFLTEDLLAAFLAFYGLALFEYFMARSLSTSAYSAGLPYAFILCFWLAWALKKLKADKRRNAVLAFIILGAWALWSSSNYVSYPNIWNLSRNPLVDPMVFSPLPDGRSYFNHLFSQLPMEGRLPLNSLGETDEKLTSEKDFAKDEDLSKFYDQEFNFGQDARLIDELVPPGGKVALVSSFETKILMDANRAPFFYYVPLVISRPMHMRTMVVTSLYTKGHFLRTISQIETLKPQYIFIERIFCKENIDLVNYNDGSAFLSLMRYIHAHYEGYRNGHFLMAMKRI